MSSKRRRFSWELKAKVALEALRGDRTLHESADGFQARRLIGDWVRFYNLERPHSALDGRTPAEADRGDPPVDRMDKPLCALPTSPLAQQQQQEARTEGILAT